MRITYIGTDYNELRSRARNIAAWLSPPTWSRLIIHDEPDKYYLAKVTAEIDLESLWESGSAEVAFDCQPFAYGVEESIFSFSTIQSAQFTFANPGTRLINYKSPHGSKFVIKVAGSWTTLSLGMNGKTLNYPTAGTGTVIFNNVEMEVSLDGVNKFGILTGDIDTFLHILPGYNTLNIGGTNLNVFITLEFISLWF